MKQKILIVILLVLVALVALKIKQAPEVIRDRAWTVLGTYLAFAKSHDLNGLRGLSYQISDTCNDPLKKVACEALMDNVSIIGEAFHKEEFVNIEYDKKQIILSTDYFPLAIALFNATSTYLTRSIIFLTRDEAGNPQLLSLNQADGIGMDNNGLTDEEVMAKLNKRSIDSDEDGLPDEAETSTDPQKRDTNGDGWWDSIEKLFYK